MDTPHAGGPGGNELQDILLTPASHGVDPMVGKDTRAMLMEREMVIFDLDGTLYDLPVDWAGLKEEFNEMIDDEFYVDGGYIMSAYRYADGRCDLKERMLDLQARYELARIDQSQRVEPGIACVEWRLKRGLRCSIFSMNTERAVGRLIGGFNFHPVITIDKVKMPKPSPEGLIRLIDMIGMKGDDVLFVGNTDNDAGSAAGAGIDHIDVAEIDREWFG